MNKSVREKEAVLSVFAELVRPLMRVAFEYGISAGEIAGVVRRTYIQALEARLSDQKRSTTDARLAVVAGLAKSDVTALREALRAGAPRSLRELVDAACPGADGEALLDELVAAGSVEVIDSMTARCLSRAYVPKGADVKRIERMGRFLAVVSANFVHNLLRVSPEPVYFERTVVSDESISEAGRDKFLAIAGERGQELLTELDTFLTRLAASERSEAGRKYGVGGYFFEDQSTDQETEVQTKTDDQKTSRTVLPVEEIDVLAGLGHKK